MLDLFLFVSLFLMLLVRKANKNKQNKWKVNDFIVVVYKKQMKKLLEAGNGPKLAIWHKGSAVSAVGTVGQSIINMDTGPKAISFEDIYIRGA